MTALRPLAKISGIAFCGLFLAALSGAQEAASLDDYEPGCLEETTIRLASREQVIDLHEAEQIRLAVETYLEEEKPVLEPGVFGPSKAFIDCQGTVRLGAWILESGSAYAEKPELSLSFRVFTNEHFLVRQVVGLVLEEGQWKVTGVGRSTAHRRY